MTIRSVAPDEQIEAIEAVIAWLKNDGFALDLVPTLASIASDLRARTPGAPSVALHELTRRLTAAHRSKTRLGYDPGAMIGVGEELVARWPIVKAALDLFGPMLESGDDPREVGFRIGFEHAVAGGHDAAAQIPALKGHEPLVLYFGNEEDRREMIDAIQLAKPGMAEVKIPERRRVK